MRPNEPVLRHAATAEDHDTEEIVETTTVDADDDHLTPVEKSIQGQARVRPLQPVFSTRPTIGAQRETDLNVEMLRSEQGDLRWTFALGREQLAIKERFVDGLVQVGVDERPIALVLPPVV